MPIPTANEIRMNRHVRHYLQFNGALPTNLPQFYGQDAQYLVLASASIPEYGTIAPVWTPNPRITDGSYQLIQKTIAAPGTLPKATLTILERHGAVPRQLTRMSLLNVYEYIGLAKDVSDFLNGADDGCIIYGGGRPETKAMGKRGDWMADGRLEDSIPLTFDYIYPIGPLGLGEKDTSTVNVIDVTYGSFVRTGEFGPPDRGTNTLYQLVIHGTGAATTRYSLDGGATWTALAITGIGATADPDKIRVMGNYLVVLSSTENAYYFITLNPQTGAPVGTAWTKVTTGIVTAKGPTDMFVFNPREAFLCGKGGYLYKITDVPSGVTVLDAGTATTVDLGAISGIQDYGVVVAVGATAKVVISTNRGQTFSVSAAAPGAGTIQGVDVLGQAYYWVCDNAGAAYYTLDGGVTWTSVSGLTGMTNAKAVRFATKEVGYIGGATVTPLGQLWTTWNGGKNWTLSGWRVINQLTVQTVNSIAIPDVAKNDPETAADNIALACLGDAGVTGAVVIGSTVRV